MWINFTVIITCLFFLTVKENYPSHPSTHDNIIPLFKIIISGHFDGDALVKVFTFLLYFNLQVYY